MLEHAQPICDSILGAIGNTPIIELATMLRTRNLDGGLFVKCEYLNPGFSKKDRVALEMLREAKLSGELRSGQTVVELTSGNTGTGLAIACRALGHPFIAVMSKGNTVERATMMRALGAQVELVDQASNSPPNQVSGQDLALVEDRTQELTRQHGAFRGDQFTLEGNVLAHERHTGPEIWQQAGGRVEVFVDFAGTGGSFTGVMRYLRKKNNRIRGYVIEPESVAVLSNRPVTNTSHKIQGGGYNMADLPLLDRSLVEGYLQVSDEQAIAATRALAREAGVFAGFSSGAALAAAFELLAGAERGKAIAFLAADSGLKYLSTDLYT